MRLPSPTLRRLALSLVLASSASAAAPAATTLASGIPPVQMFVPGFVVRELPLTLTNQNNSEYAPDGRLFTAGYDGRVHLLRDTDGDGLEDQVTTLAETTGGDFPLGIAFHEGALYVTYKTEIVRFRDRDGDGVPETREVALSNWDTTGIIDAPMILKARMDFANGLAIGPDGNFYVAMGNAAFQNPYRRDVRGNALYRPSDLRGCVLRISPEGKKVEQIATGLRYVVSIQFNRAGDLFLTDQEGATWVPNGNPFDELLHIQEGRHYGFPSRHPKYLPHVIDEPSVFDYAPQHQSVCGFRFNESGPARARFGPPEWEGDAILTGQSRGKLYRTKLAKTAAGYVAQTHLIAAIQALPVDCTISPQGDLIVVAHTGKPDWGTGPQGIGRIFKISYLGDPSTPQPVLAYAASENETRVEFLAPLTPTAATALTKESVALRAGRFVGAGDSYEKAPPGYAVVKAQRTERTAAFEAHEPRVDAGRRTLILHTSPRTAALQYGFALNTPAAPQSRLSHTRAQDDRIELAHDLTGVTAEWEPAAPPASRDRIAPAWRGWLPHPDLSVARAFTTGSAPHQDLFHTAQQRGTLRLHGQLDLALMLRPEIQPGSTPGFEYAPETVTVVFASQTPLNLITADHATIERVDAATVRLIVNAPRRDVWVPFEVSVQTTENATPTLSVHWFTAEDARPRALPLRRVLTRWARPAPPVSGSREIPEIAGGDWEKGRSLYFGAAACHACHSIRGEGTKFGPDLTNSIHRDYAALLKDIVQPSAAINPDHLGYAVELEDGTTTAGIVVADTESELSLAGPAGEPTRVPKQRIRRTEPMKMSLMPDGLLQALSPEQVRDLMTFLLTEQPNR